ncbi:MAG: hypothetical protein M9938_05885 [Solirubrobacterales bacterium]|nr:hypothetical protein [Solirubrobacterales bacterium]
METETRRPRWTAIGIFLALVLGMALLPSAAGASPNHFLKIYKVEVQVDLNGGQSAHEHVYCNAGDYAVDGMWRVDHVDQANPQIGVFGDMRDVSVNRSYSDLQQGGNGAKWHFEMVNNADGRAQLKIFAVCLGSKTVENSHQHRIYVRPLKTTAWFPGSDFSSPALRCGSGEITVGPGFKRLSGGDLWLKSSYPGSPLNASWNWNFTVSTPTSMEMSVLCLRKTTGWTWGHRHNLLTYLKPGYWPLGAQAVKKKAVQEKRVSCADGYKAIVGAVGIAPWNHGWIHFLGMDPRPKTRAFKFWNTYPYSDLPVYLATICLRVRTGNQY